MEFYQQSLQAYPRCITAIHNMATIKSEVLEQHDAALEIYQQFFHINILDITMEMGYIYVNAKQNDKAIKCFEKVMKMHPYCDEPYAFMYGMVLDKIVDILRVYYTEHIELFDDDDFASNPTISKLPNDLQQNLKLLAAEAIQYLNDGLNMVLENDEIKFLQDAKIRSLKTELVNVLGLPEAEVALFDKNSQNLHWTENQHKQHFKQNLYKFLLHCNVGLSNIDFSFYTYYLSAHTVGFDKVKEFCDVKIITTIRKE